MSRISRTLCRMEIIRNVTSKTTQPVCSTQRQGSTDVHAEERPGPEQAAQEVVGSGDDETP